MSDELPKLELCPFCGSTAEVFPDSRGEGCWFVKCLRCGARGPNGSPLREAVMRWNQRHESVLGCEVCHRPFTGTEACTGHERELL